MRKKTSETPTPSEIANSVAQNINPKFSSPSQPYHISPTLTAQQVIEGLFPGLLNDIDHLTAQELFDIAQRYYPKEIINVSPNRNGSGKRFRNPFLISDICNNVEQFKIDNPFSIEGETIVSSFNISVENLCSVENIYIVNSIRYLIESYLSMWFLIWPPDLFAFTSSILSTTGAYHLVVSPPSPEKIPIDVRKSVASSRIPESHDIHDYFVWPPKRNILSSTKSSEYKLYRKDLSNPVTGSEEFNPGEITTASETNNDLPDIRNDSSDMPTGQILFGEVSKNENHPFSWSKLVQDTGRKWRRLLQTKFQASIVDDFKHGITPKHIGERERERKNRLNLNLTIHTKDRVERRLQIINDVCGYDSNNPGLFIESEKSWIPENLYYFWNSMMKAISPKWNGDIFDILCSDKEECGKYKYDFERIAAMRLQHLHYYKHKYDTGKINLSTYVKFQKNIEDRASKQQHKLNEGHFNKVWSHWEAFQCLMSLHAIADEACAGLGIRAVFLDDNGKYNTTLPEDMRDNKVSDLSFFSFAEKRLRQYGTMSNIHEQRCRILPKRHTAGVGITLRSISSNLGYHKSSVDVKWNVSTGDNDLLSKIQEASDNQKIPFTKTFSILLLPWPLEINAPDFRPEKTSKVNSSTAFNLFSYSPKTKGFSQELLIKALEGSLTECNSVDMIILPETALAPEEIHELENIIGGNKYKVSSYIAGVRHDGKRDTNGDLEELHDNIVLFKMGDISDKNLSKSEQTLKYPLVNLTDSDNIQYKHHKWKVDKTQVINYNLGHILSPNTDWWEAIKIRRRKVTFMNIGQELTICPLICEDLARQDPIADLLRTVGPSLVVTILMDGPQKKDRWSSRYATVLSEDPGSAVITLTSYGMVKRYRPSFVTTPSRAIALFKDGRGSEREIELEEGSIGVLLSLGFTGDYESTADGRREQYPTNFLTLGGIHQVRPINPT